MSLCIAADNRLPSAAVLVDRLGRPLEDLRLSLTDRCNLRCRYCMPREHFDHPDAFLGAEQLLSDDELYRLAAIFRSQGVGKLRLTGGEPLLRRGLVELVGRLASLGFSDIALTTNGTRLRQLAAALAQAGLNRVTVSLDAATDELASELADRRVVVSEVLAGLEAAATAGLGPLRVNAVIIRGVNDDQILPLAELFRGTEIELRYIEFMDVGTTNDWNWERVVRAEEMRQRLEERWPLKELGSAAGAVSKRYAWADGAGTVGFIASVSQPFCGGCVRARLTADGNLFTCLFGNAAADLGTPLRAGADDAEIIEILHTVWSSRDDRYSEQRKDLGTPGGRPEMSYLGG